MRLLLALIVPWTIFYAFKRPFAGTVALLLQLTLLGWLPASFWALYALARYEGGKQLSGWERKALSLLAQTESRNEAK